MQPGDLVQFTKKFCQAVGLWSGGPVDGKVVEPEGKTPPKNMIYVHWCDHDEPTLVRIDNIELKHGWKPN